MDKLHEEQLEHFLRKEWRKKFDHFEIVDETGINVIDVIKIDPDNSDDGIPSDLKEFAMHQIFAIGKDGLMFTYLDYLEGCERFIADTKRLIEAEKRNQMKISKISRCDKLKIFITLIAAPIGFVISIMFWSEILRLLSQIFFRS